MTILVTGIWNGGGTRGICEAIGRALAASGVDADVRRLEDVRDLEGYAGAVIGSAVEAGRWRPPARRFIERNAYQLRLRPVWLFSAAPVGEPPEPLTEPSDVEELASLSQARDHVAFAGALAPQLPGVGDQAVVRVVHGSGGDYREWSSIDDWARRIARVMQQAA